MNPDDLKDTLPIFFFAAEFTSNSKVFQDYNLQVRSPDSKVSSRSAWVPHSVLLRHRDVHAQVLYLSSNPSPSQYRALLLSCILHRRTTTPCILPLRSLPTLVILVQNSKLRVLLHLSETTQTLLSPFTETHGRPESVHLLLWRPLYSSLSPSINSSCNSGIGPVARYALFGAH